MEGFKRYKNIVQRLMTIKRLKSTSQNASQIAQNLPAFSSMSIPNSTHGSQPLNSSAQFPISGEHSDSGVQVEVVSQNRSTTATCDVPTTPRVVMTNVTNPAGTMEIRPSSIKKQTTVSTPMLGTTAPSTCVNAIIIASSTGQRHQQSSTFCPSSTNQIPSKRFSTPQSQPLTIRLSANQPTVAKTPSQTAGITMTSCPRSNISQTTIRPSISTIPYASSSRPNQVFTNALTINDVTAQTTKSQDSSRPMSCISNRPGMNLNVFKPAANRLSTSFSGSNSSTFSTGTTPSFCGTTCKLFAQQQTLFNRSFERRQTTEYTNARNNACYNETNFWAVTGQITKERNTCSGQECSHDWIGGENEITQLS